MIRNPILPGFNPDPSIVRVGDDYWIATSTFEWYPGVQIHHSRDLADWSLVTRPLRRAAQLDMRGNPDSCGVWAPCLSHAHGRFWLVYTDVKRFDGNFKDTHNYVVHATDPLGEWSEPIRLNSSGFDPSLFHDEDGRSWLLNLVWNHRATALGQTPRHSPFGGIALQEFDVQQECLVGDSRLIFSGSERGLSEGAHLMRHEGGYLLIVAEGGTGYEHAVVHARSNDIGGPYELHPDGAVITADPADGARLQRAGHGQPVQTPQGEWYHVHLCGRPLEVTDPARRRCPLGRETAIQRMELGSDGWLRMAHGTAAPADTVAPPSDAVTAALRAGPSTSMSPGNPLDAHAGAAASPVDDSERHYRFAAPSLPLDFQWLRTPDWQRLFSLEERPGWLRLYGRESPGSWFEQALVARRQQHLAYAAQTVLDVAPATFQQAAGLIAYYDRHRYHALLVTHDEELGRVLTVMQSAADWPEGRLSWPLDAPLSLPAGEVTLRVQIDEERLVFSWKQAGEFNRIGPELDASQLSDEAGRGEHGSFTGAFVGMIAFDVSGAAMPADFSSFDYVPATADACE